MSGLKYLPPPKTPGMTVEDWFVRKLGGVGPKYPTFWGKKDAEILGGFFGLNFPVVIDHKSCGSFQYMPDEKGLQTGVQSGMYGWDAMEAASKDMAQLRWTYMRTKGARKSLPVITTITRMQAEDVMERVELVANDLIVLKTELKEGEAIEAPPSFGGCEAYGGCPHKDRCKPTAQQALDAIMTDKTNTDLLKSLRSRKKKNNAAAAPAASTEKKEEDKAEASTDKVNSSDRSSAPPPPPEAREVGDQWFQPVWDNTDWEWKFPEEYHKALEAAEDAKKVEEKAAKDAAKKKPTNRKKGTTTKTEAPASSGSGIMIELKLDDETLDKLATLVAEKIKA